MFIQELNMVTHYKRAFGMCALELGNNLQGSIRGPLFLKKKKKKPPINLNHLKFASQATLEILNAK